MTIHHDFQSLNTFAALKHNIAHYCIVLFIMSYSSLFIQLSGPQLMTKHGSSMAQNWTHAEILGITVYDLHVIIAPSVFNYYKFKFTVQMHLLSYLEQYKSKDLLCLYENKKYEIF